MSKHASDEIAYLGMTEPRLRAVWNLVKDITNWKNPIDAYVPMGKADMDEIITAVTFYAGGVPTVIQSREPFTGALSWHVTGHGYYTWIGA